VTPLVAVLAVLGLAAVPDDATMTVIVGATLVDGPIARLQAGQPAHLALLDADPRPGEGAPPRVRRLWIAGKGRAIAGEPVR
jgi:hypothetical protein